MGKGFWRKADGGEMRSGKYNKLYLLAKKQRGYFTAQQAIKCGYPRNYHSNYCHKGIWKNEGRGLFRFPDCDSFDQEDRYVYYFLWSRNRNEEPQAVVSHQSASYYHGLCAECPDRLYLTVPLSFQHKIPDEVICHYEDLSKEDVEEHTGFNVTTNEKTRKDVGMSSLAERQYEGEGGGSGRWLSGFHDEVAAAPVS